MLDLFYQFKKYKLLNTEIMKKIILGLAIMAFIVAGTVNVVAQEKVKEKAKTEVKKSKKACCSTEKTKKACCSDKKACDPKKACDTKEKKAKKKEK